MIQESIQLAVDEVGTNGRVTITEYIDWLWENLFLIELTADGTYQPPSRGFFST